MRAKAIRRASLHFLPAVAGVCLAWFLASAARGHDVITSTITYNRDLRPILQARCVACHRSGGSAFSLESYADVRPWAKAIEEEVLSRRMPPWGAVSGFGRFRNDPSLSMAEMQQFAEWAEGGAPEGEPGELSAGLPTELSGEQAQSAASSPGRTVGSSILLTGETRLTRAMRVSALEVVEAAPESSFRLTAELPNGQITPLLWIDRFNPLQRTFELRQDLALPRGTRIKGLPAGVRLRLLPASR